MTSVSEKRRSYSKNSRSDTGYRRPESGERELVSGIRFPFSELEAITNADRAAELKVDLVDHLKGRRELSEDLPLFGRHELQTDRDADGQAERIAEAGTNA